MTVADRRGGGVRRPLIGISAYREQAAWGVWRVEAALLPFAYVERVAAAGGVPLLLPPLDGAKAQRDPDGVEAAEDMAQAATAAVAALDGLLLSGGPDLDPALYAASRHLATVDTRPERDTWELALLDAALARDIPLLGVCRGVQLINVALGGTLCQHLPDRTGHDKHRPVPGTYGVTQVALLPDALPGSVLGPRVEVPCHHHQALGMIARGVEVTGRAADGTVEAVQLAGRRFALGVQWHPEEGADDGLFRALIVAAGGTVPADTVLADTVSANDVPAGRPGVPAALAAVDGEAW
ncbi:MAG TPA: gamma-glutamyl-gamma-aminobutyrate hydrolase family protein [Actinocrinis sp.]